MSADQINARQQTGNLQFLSMSQLVSPYRATSQGDLKSTNKKSGSKQELLSKSKPKDNQPPEIIEIKSNSKIPEDIAETVIEEEKPEQPSIPPQEIKSVAKSTKRQSLRAKQSARISQKHKEMEKDQVNQAVLKVVEASGKQIKTGNNQIESNIRQYSAQNQREDPPEPETKKVNTESKKTKNAASAMKVKTQMKEVRQEPEKSSIVGAAKRSTRRSAQQNELIPEKAAEENKIQSKSKSKTKKEQPENEHLKPQSTKKSVKSSKKESEKESISKTKEEREEKEEEKQEKEEKGNKMNSILKKDGTSSKKMLNFAGQQKSQVLTKGTRSAMKSVAKSGVKKVKVEAKLGDEN